MKIINISGENGISTLDTFSIKIINNPLYKMTPSKVEDSSTGPAYYINDNNELVTIPSETPIYKDGRFWSVPSFSNYLANPLSPANQTTGTLGVGNYTVWMRGTGSVAVSANTATITGAGSATDGSPLHFSVTVSGTVYVVVTGDCTVFQLTDTIFSTEPFLVNGVLTLVNHAGTTYVPMNVGDKPYSLLDGEIISNSFVFYQESGTTGFTKTENNKYHYTGDGTNNELLNSLVISSGEKKQVVFKISNKTGAGDISVSLGSNAIAATYNSDGIFTLRKTYVDRSYLRFRATFIGSFDIEIISFCVVDKPECTIGIKLTPKFSHSDFPVSHTESILYSGTIDILTLSTDSSGNGYIKFSDGTNTASVPYDWAYDEEITIEVPLGYNVSEAAYKMQLIVNGTASALTAFAGSLNPDIKMTVGRNNDYPFGVAVKILDLKQSDWI